MSARQFGAGMFNQPGWPRASREAAGVFPLGDNSKPLFVASSLFLVHPDFIKLGSFSSALHGFFGMFPRINMLYVLTGS